MSIRRKEPATPNELTASLAAYVLNWRVTPDRFLTGKRGWLPRWKFQPAQKLSDAIRLLEAAKPQEYSVRVEANGDFLVKVRINGTSGQARAKSKPIAICMAIAHAIGLIVPDGPVKTEKR
jgi:hypothetical protein